MTSPLPTDLNVHNRFAAVGEAEDGNGICSLCGSELPESEFRVDAAKPSGRQSRCKSCQSSPRMLDINVGPSVTELELRVVEGAACKGSPSHASWNAAAGGPSAPFLLVCAQCPVREECLELGDYLEFSFYTRDRLLTKASVGPVGIYGGETPAMRRRRRRREAACQEAYAA